jgi:tRNA U34 2-thiouridine synthase MnmA/TrmU
VTVGSREALDVTVLVTGLPNWLTAEAPVFPLRARTQLRAHGNAFACTVEPLDTSAGGVPGSAAGVLRVTTDEPVARVAAGQLVAFYDEPTGTRVLGSARLESCGIPALA